jgi:hypothetical protein
MMPTRAKNAVLNGVSCSIIRCVTIREHLESESG